MQDELALVRQDLHHAQQQLFREAAKQEPKDFQLMKVYEEAIRNLTAREERLMEEARAMRLEAQAQGEQACQSAYIVQWLRNVSAYALELRVDALEPARPEIQCFVSANLGKNMLSD